MSERRVIIETFGPNRWRSRTSRSMASRWSRQQQNRSRPTWTGCLTGCPMRIPSPAEVATFQNGLREDTPSPNMKVPYDREGGRLHRFALSSKTPSSGHAAGCCHDAAGHRQAASAWRVPRRQGGHLGPPSRAIVAGLLLTERVHDGEQLH